MLRLLISPTFDRLVFSTWDTGQVYRGSAPAVHLLAQGAVTVGARPLRGYEPPGCHDPRGAGAAVGQRSAEAVPRQTGDPGRAGLVPKEGGLVFPRPALSCLFDEQQTVIPVGVVHIIGWKRAVRPVCLSR